MDVDEKTAQVAFGALKMRLPLDRLVPLKRAPRRETRARMASSAAEKRARAEKMRAAPAGEGGEDAIVDLRGMRADDAVALLDKRLDELLAAGASRVRVVHGHGTGALKRAIREHLAISPHVAGTEVPADDAGGDGATWVRL
jgi:DNA mismatch repair protein MutS2